MSSLPLGSSVGIDLRIDCSSLTNGSVAASFSTLVGARSDEMICRVFVSGVKVTDFACVGAGGAKPPVMPEGGSICQGKLHSIFDRPHRAVLEDGIAL